MHENNVRISKNVQRIVILSIVLVGIIAFRLMTAPERKSRLANRAPRRPKSHPVAAPAQPVRADRIAAPFDPTSVVVDMQHLWTVNPFHAVIQSDEAPATVPPTGSQSPQRETDPEVLDLHTGVGDLRVSAILDNGRARAAIIGNRVIREGDLVDGRLQVVAIHADRVEVVATATAAEPDSSIQPADSPH